MNAVVTIAELTDAALLTTFVVALLAAAFAIVIGVRTWRDLQRVRLTQQAAVQLIDAHAARLLDSADAMSAQLATVADGGEQLANHVADLRGDVDHLRWMLRQIPDTRTALREELLELVLPTRDRTASHTEQSHA